MANELFGIFATSSTGNYFLVINPANPAEAWDAVAGDWAAKDRTDADQQIAASGEVVESGTDGTFFANLPSGLDRAQEYDYYAYDSSDEFQGVWRYKPLEHRVSLEHLPSNDGVLQFLLGQPYDGTFYFAFARAPFTGADPEWYNFNTSAWTSAIVTWANYLSTGSVTGGILTSNDNPVTLDELTDPIIGPITVFIYSSNAGMSKGLVKSVDLFFDGARWISAAAFAARYCKDLTTNLEPLHQGVCLLSTSIATVNSTTEFILDDGPNFDAFGTDAYAVIVDLSNNDRRVPVAIATYEGSTKTLTLEEAPPFTVAASDTIYIISGNPRALRRGPQFKMQNHDTDSTGGGEDTISWSVPD